MSCPNTALPRHSHWPTHICDTLENRMLLVTETLRPETATTCSSPRLPTSTSKVNLLPALYTMGASVCGNMGDFLEQAEGLSCRSIPKHTLLEL